MVYCLAIDIGASGGRHILGAYKNGKIECTEVYRFENGFHNENGTLAWDVEYLTRSVIEGIKKCGELGKIPKTVAIDTWGVDYVLLDAAGKEILPAVSYRDARTAGVPEEIDKIISYEQLYARTGIQRQNYNTIYQLYCDLRSGKLAKAEHLLMMPEYLSYRLTGVMKSEYTIASTTSLVNAKSCDWDDTIIEKLGIKRSLFKNICKPGVMVGGLREEIRKYVGFDTTVVFAPAHDTASAVAACSLSGHSMYISSGTWSLIGAQNQHPVLSRAAMQANFTNEGGASDTYRFLKNIMGMWLFQSIRRELGKQYTYDELMQAAMSSGFAETFDPNDPRLVAPASMLGAIRDCLGKSDLPLCDTLSSVYHSLAASYRTVVQEIEEITGEAVESIRIVGGGSQDAYLNALTEKYTGKPVTAGPVEATALGNLRSQFAILLDDGHLFF